jgi:hypothetical protein
MTTRTVVKTVIRDGEEVLERKLAQIWFNYQKLLMAAALYIVAYYFRRWSPAE